MPYEMALCRAVTLWRLFFDLRGVRGYPQLPRSCQGGWRFRCSLRSQLSRSCQGGWGFRCSLRSQRNGGGRRREQGGDGRRGKKLRQRHAPARRPSPLLLPACGAPFRALCDVRRAICDLRFTVSIPKPRGRAALQFSILHSSFLILNSRYGSINRKYASV